MEKLSIFIPTRNRAGLLQELLEQILSQIFRDHLTVDAVKVYISDNCSDDGTAEVINMAIAKAPLQIIAISNTTNIGPIENIARAKTFPQGEYCWIHSDDELMESNALTQILELLHKEPIGLLINKNRDYNFGMTQNRFSNYHEFLLACTLENCHLPLAHTHLTANIFRRDIFDMITYRQKTGTSYAQMYALVAGLKNCALPIVLSDKPIMVMRPRRADPDADTVKKNLFFDYANIVDRQIDYLKWVKRTFGMRGMDLRRIMKMQGVELKSSVPLGWLYNLIRTFLKRIRQSAFGQRV